MKKPTQINQQTSNPEKLSNLETSNPENHQTHMKKPNPEI